MEQKITNISLSHLECLFEEAIGEFCTRLITIPLETCTEDDIREVQKETAEWATPDSVKDLCELAIETPDLLTTQTEGAQSITDETDPSPYTLLYENVYRVILSHLESWWWHKYQEEDQEHGQAAT